MSDYASERNLARERILRVLSDGEWHSLADVVGTDRDRYHMYSAVLHQLVLDKRVEHYKNAWVRGVQRPGYRLISPSTPARARRPAQPRGAARTAILDLLSDGQWYTYEAMVIKLPAYTRQTLQRNTQRLRTEGLVISREIVDRRFHGPAFMFALAEAVE